MNLTQLLVTQQNVDEICARFGLTEVQTLEAMNAVLPAFSEGLKRQTSSPRGAAGLLEALASGHHVQYADHPGSAMDPDGISEGNAILGHLFGNKNVSRAVAKHAAASTGISDSMFKQLLPALASMVMGALFKGMTGSSSTSRGSRGGGNGGALGGLGDLLGDALGGALSGGGGSGGSTGGGGLLGQILEGLAGGLTQGAGQSGTQGSTQGTRRRRAPSRRRRGSSGLPGMFEDLIGDALAGGKRRPTRSRRTKSAPNTSRRRKPSAGGLEGLLEDFLGGGGGGGGTSRGKRRTRSSRRAPAPENMPKPRSRSRSRNPGGSLKDIFGDFLEPGGNTTARQQRQTGSIFDEFLQG
ncbi:MAG: DUF937 domain-containing protein [Rhizobiaceae bacterium]